VVVVIVPCFACIKCMNTSPVLSGLSQVDCQLVAQCASPALHDLSGDPCPPAPVCGDARGRVLLVSPGRRRNTGEADSHGATRTSFGPRTTRATGTVSRCKCDPLPAGQSVQRSLTFQPTLGQLRDVAGDQRPGTILFWANVIIDECV